MKNFRKNLLFTILSTIAMIISLSITCLAANEIEPNNGSNTASVIETDVVCSGAIDYVTTETEDVDWYKFTTNKDYFIFDFEFSLDENNYAKLGEGWNVYLYDEEGIELYSQTDVRTKFSTAIYPLTGSFYIKVESSNTPFIDDCPVGCFYTIKINTFEDKSWEDENNDVVSKAFEINTDSIYHGTLHSYNDIDWYKFTNDKDYFIFNFLINEETDIDKIHSGWWITLYSADTKTVIKQYIDITSDLISYELPFSGECYIKIEPNADEVFLFEFPRDCYYDIRIDTYEDSSWEDECNDSTNNSNKIELNKTYKGSLHNEDDVDYFYVETTTECFNVYFNIDENNPCDEMENGWRISVYPYGSGKEIVTYEAVMSEKNSFDIPFNGKMVIKIEPEDYTPVDCVYNLKVTQHSLSEKWESETNDIINSAKEIENSKAYRGNLHFNNDVDYFKYIAPCNGVLTLNFSRDVSDKIGNGWEILITKANGAEVDKITVCNDLDFSKNNIAISKGETYFIKVHSKDRWDVPLYVNYKLGVSFTAKTDNVSGVNVSQTTSSVKLSWNKIISVKGYKIYTYNSTTKKYTLIDTTSKTTYTVKNLKPGTVYKYYVKAYQNYNNKEILSPKYTKIVAVTEPKAPTSISATQSTSVINLKWSASSGATGYRVYQYSPSKGKYVQIASVKTTSYKKATNLKAGTEYSFKIKPYTKLSDGTVLWGTASDAFVTATECKAPNITSVTSPSKSKATVKWSNVDGETGYQLYYSTKKDSGFKKVDSYSANKLTGSKTFSSSASGKTIYFKVRAYKKVNGQTIYSDWSTVKSVKLK